MANSETCHLVHFKFHFMPTLCRSKERHISSECYETHHTSSVEHSRSTQSQRRWLLRQRLLPWHYWPILGAYTSPDAISIAVAVSVATSDATAPACRVLDAVHGAYHRAGCCWRRRLRIRTYNYKILFKDFEQKAIIQKNSMEIQSQIIRTYDMTGGARPRRSPQPLFSCWTTWLRICGVVQRAYQENPYMFDIYRKVLPGWHSIHSICQWIYMQIVSDCSSKNMAQNHCSINLCLSK